MQSLSLFALVQDDMEMVEQILRDIALVENKPMSALLGHVLRGKGKRLRPALVLLAAKFHDYPLEQLAHVAAAVELLHTASLVHDDVVDSAVTRRGNPTLNAFAGQRAPILVGDYVFARSALAAVAGRSLHVMDVFAHTLMRICEGELHELLSSRQWPQAKDEYYHKISCKTASLFSLSTECGAILSGLGEDGITALRDYGHALGMAFQIVDDILDLTGDERQLGKPVGGDLRQGTVTLPILYHLSSQPDSPVRAIVVADHRSEDDIREAIKLVVASSAVELSYADSRAFVEQAKAALRVLPDNDSRRALMALADYVVERAT